MGAATRLAVAIPLIAALGWATSTAVSFARGDVAVLAASREMGAWAAARLQPQTGTWDSVREKLAFAQGLSPSDPTTQELLGVLYSGRKDSAEYLSNGVVHFTHALQVRPVSPYTWANLAEVMYNQGDTDRKFRLALGRAAALGPSEPEVQRMVADYGLAVWAEVANPTRQAIDHMVAAGLRRNPLEMLQISERRGRLDVACRHIFEVRRIPRETWSKFCQSTEATP